MTTRTILIAGGVAVGAFVLFKLVLSPSPIAARKTPRPTDALSVAGLTGLATALSGLFGSSKDDTTSSPDVGLPSGPGYKYDPNYAKGYDFIGQYTGPDGSFLVG